VTKLNDRIPSVRFSAEAEASLLFTVSISILNPTQKDISWRKGKALGRETDHSPSCRVRVQADGATNRTRWRPFRYLSPGLKKFRKYVDISPLNPSAYCMYNLLEHIETMILIHGVFTMYDYVVLFSPQTSIFFP
jgi:hypothetical protein